MITISTELAAAIAQWAHPDPDRNLDLVVFRDGKVIATDARRVVIVPCETHGAEIGVSRTHLLAAVAAQDALARADQDPRIAHDLTEVDGLCGEAHMVPTYTPRAGRELHLSLEDGGLLIVLSPDRLAVRVPIRDISQWPYEKILAAADTAAPDTPASPNGYYIDPRYLYAIDQVHRAMGGRYGVRCVALSADGLGPMRFTSHLGATFVVMPTMQPAEAS